MCQQRENAKRRAAASGYLGKHFTTQQWRALLEYFGHRCLACGASAQADEDLSVDHVIPLSLGGSNAIENIQPLCETCNSLKGATIRDYRPSFARRPSA
jgi:5-methylcytosine-specific restriction endonuclease McrA